jgi:hypothetical protein
LTIPRPTIAVPFALFDFEAQDEFVCSLEGLERERKSLVGKELELQQTIEQGPAIRNALIELEVQRIILVKNVRSRQKAVSPAVVWEKDAKKCRLH